MFSFYVDDIILEEEWFRLTHVCQRWRYIAFASSLRLNLRLYCRARKPVRMLNSWPTLPIVVAEPHCSEEGADNLISAFEHNARVCGIFIGLGGVSTSLLGRFSRALQEPFPGLTDLALQSADGTLVIPETFLGGSAPHLRSCRVDYLPLPALRTLLLSASHLLYLCLWRVPHSAYISPEAMVTCLSAATSLKSLDFRFLSPRSRPDRATRRPPPLIRTILPALTDFHFHGVSEYLEDFISQVDAPLLNVVDIRLFHQLTFDVSQLHQLIGRTETLGGFNIANVVLDDDFTRVDLSRQMRAYSRPMIGLAMRCSGSDWQLSFLAQACRLLSPTLSTFETLNVRESEYQLRSGWEDHVENSQWLELFHSFNCVKNLCLSKKIVPLVVPTLQQLAEERVTDVLPVLQNLYLEGLQPSEPIQDGIGQFVARRRFFNHPVTVEPWD